MIAIQVLMDKLNSFETPDEVAGFLQSQNITGDLSEASSCVISNWVKRESGAADVTTSNCVKVWGSLADGGPQEKYQVNANLFRFLKYFDGGAYLDLVDLRERQGEDNGW